MLAVPTNLIDKVWGTEKPARPNNPVMVLDEKYSGKDFALKIEAVRKEIDRQGLKVDIEVDGGIDAASGPRCVAAGATVLAAASSIFKAPDPAEATRRLAEVTGRGR